MNISNIINSINEVIDNACKIPAPYISPIILGCSLARRPGLSCVRSTSNILGDIASKGIPTEDLPDGQPNLMNKLITSIVCETVRAIKEDANVQISMPPGALNITATGANAGGPVVSTGFNINFGAGNALIQ